MAVGVLAPMAHLQFLDNNGQPLAGGKLYTYAAGTSTPLETYSDVEMDIANQNPIILNSAGRPAHSGSEVAVYLAPGVSYKFILTTAADVTVWTQDDITGTAEASDFAGGVAGGRLTLESNVPVSTTNQNAKTTLYYTPYQGNQIALYDGALWANYVFPQISTTIFPAVANQMYDVFVVLSGLGEPALDYQAWTNDTTRAVALMLQDGVLVKTGDATQRYLGSVRTTGVAGQMEDSLTKRFVWNYYHRITRPMVQADATANWSYATATLRQARATATNQVEVAIGVAEIVIPASYSVIVANDNAALQAMWLGIGLDSTTVLAVNQQGNRVVAGPTATEQISGHAKALLFPAAGYHAITMLEAGSGTGTTTWYGTGTYLGSATLLAEVEG